ncbi:TMEM30A (predicted) [Pycnogonum litorale]
MNKSKVKHHLVKEFLYDYTHCEKSENLSCADIIAKNISIPCTCTIRFEFPDSFESDVYLYYGLTNFYQNHRRYVKSRDDSQLLGQSGKLSSDCEPFDYVKDGDKKVPIAPCGAIANSLFNGW